MDKTSIPVELEDKGKIKSVPVEKETDHTKYILYAFALFAIVVISFAGFSLFKLYSPNAVQAITSTPTGIATASAMTMTDFDKQLGREMMDKDGDGKCDSCSMPVGMCMDSGQIQCNIDSESTIGVLGSQHIHADFKVYINGKPLDFSDKAHMERMRSGQPVSSFIHVDSGAPAPEKTGDILHMHATGVPLWIFFQSIELELPAGAKAYVNSKLIEDWQNHVFNDMDKIVITDGVGNLNEQQNSVTDFAKVH